VGGETERQGPPGPAWSTAQAARPHPPRRFPGLQLARRATGPTARHQHPVRTRRHTLGGLSLTIATSVTGASFVSGATPSFVQSRIAFHWTLPTSHLGLFVGLELL